VAKTNARGKHILRFLPPDFSRIFSTHHRMSHLPFQLIALHVT